jgi:hypothetical protein
MSGDSTATLDNTKWVTKDVDRKSNIMISLFSAAIKGSRSPSKIKHTSTAEPLSRSPFKTNGCNEQHLSLKNHMPSISYNVQNSRAKS